MEEEKKINKIFKAFRKYAKKHSIKIIYGSDGIAECPYFQLNGKIIHLKDNEENAIRLRELVHEWTHSTYIITNRNVFDDYPLEELVAEKTAYDVLNHYKFYEPQTSDNTIEARKKYTRQFKHASYIDFWITNAKNIHKENSISEIIEMVTPHIEVARQILIEVIDKESE